MKTFFLSILLLAGFICITSSINSQQSLQTLPTLTEIVAREVTGTFFNHTFAVNDPRLFVQLGAALSSTNDFGGVPGAENYDIFYSDPNGNLDPNGTCVTIECRFLGSSGGGGCNVAHLELVFSNGFRISPNLLSNFYGTGTNYIVGSELNAVDCNPNTFTTMGNNSATPNTMFLSLTFDFSALISEVFITACKGDGTNYSSGGTIFNEQNPSGVGHINNNNCYNSIEIVEMTFDPLYNENFSYTGCTGDNYAITFGNVTFDEQNPTGLALVPGIIGCDTLYNVNLSFVPLINENFSYTGCTGDNYAITFGNVTFDEQNPTGQALVPGIIGCDTLYNVNLSFNNCADCEIYAPNIIALSTQSNNENFIALFNESCNFTDISLKIYNRWGNLVHKSNELTWDGYVNGLKSETDVYVYAITYNLDGRFYFKYGDIMVLK